MTSALGSSCARGRNDNVFTERITTAAGEGEGLFQCRQAASGGAPCSCHTTLGHSTGMIVLVDWPWDYGMKPGGNDGASLLQLNTDKERYSVGDEISLTFPAPENGRAIITIANSAGLPRHQGGEHAGRQHGGEGHGHEGHGTQTPISM
ncbi:MAG: hypothetical protein U5L72_17775 [Bacteroidales bacterium]|nr:hypothetical protein [Bacteroidales bacterium]